MDNDTLKKKLHTIFKTYQDLYNPQSREKLWPISPQTMNLQIESFTPSPTPSITFRFTVTHEMSSINRTLHGGCAITLVDELTTILLAAMSRPGFYSQYGVSTGLRTSFLRPVKRGSSVRAVCELVHMGGRQALLQTRMLEVDGGGGERLCLVAEHEKANTDSVGETRL